MDNIDNSFELNNLEPIDKIQMVVLDPLQFQQLLNKIDTADSGGTGEGSNEEILTAINQLNSNLEVFLPVINDTSKLIMFYGFALVPLIVIVLMLWWFIRQFLR